MPAKYQAALLILLTLVLTFLAAAFLTTHNIAVLNPAGLIASRERNLIILATILMLLIVIPVFAMTFFIAWKYRAGNKKAKYTPDWDRNKILEFSWWAIPTAIISVLAVVAWQSSHDLDPFRPLSTDQKPLTIQVVALQWKWLFIYPEQHIATVNFVQFPTAQPVNFQITSDAPMNSFWIPQLGGQIYAMSGMSTQLHLLATRDGTYAGSSANISGRGFAGMRFTAKSTSPADFNEWVHLVQQTKSTLTTSEYDELLKPSQNSGVIYYSSTQAGLYNDIIMKYTMPMPMPDMNHNASASPSSNQTVLYNPNAL